jgi:Tol biopolymer transport system component
VVEKILGVQRSTWIIGALILATAGLAIPGVRHLREVPPPPPPTLTLTLGAPQSGELGAGDEPLDAAISPDQRQVVFAATRDGTTMLWRRTLASDRTEALAGTLGAQLPSWSPTGDALAFFAGTQLKKLSLADGLVSDLAQAPTPSGATWLPDGSILFAPQSTGTIRRLRDGTTSDATTLRPGDRAHVFPISTGNGADFVYTALGESGRRTVRLVHDRGERDLTGTSGHGQVVAGHVLVVRDEALLAYRLDDAAGTLRGQAATLATSVGTTRTGRNLFVASPRMVLSSRSSSRARELAWFDLTGTRTGTMGQAGDLWQVRLSPDDRHAAVTLMAPLLRTLDIAVVPAASTEPSQPLTLALAADTDPVWAPDGRRITFRSLQTGRPALFSKRVHDKDAEEETLVETDATPTDWTGANVVAHTADASSSYDIVAFDQARRTRETIVKSGFSDTDGRWSPDGQWLAYVSDEPGQPDVYAARRDGSRARVSFGSGTHPRWSRDSGSLFFLRGSAIMRAMLTSVSPPRFAPAVHVVEIPGIRDFDVAHHRDALIALVPVGTSAMVPVSVIVDWQSTIGATP